MTIVVPRSGSLKTSAMIGDGDDQERDRPRPEAPRSCPPLGHPVGEVDDHRELRDLRRVDGRQRADHEPAGRAADDDVEARDEDEDEQDDGDDVRRARRPSAGSGSRSASSRPSRRGPSAAQKICGPTIAERVVALEIGLHRRRRVDHQDPDRDEGDDGDEDRVVGLVALSLERLRPRCFGRRAGAAIGRPARGTGRVALMARSDLLLPLSRRAGRPPP